MPQRECGLTGPDRTIGGDMSGMSMTQYMGLLAVNQPWNLLLFMAIPVVLAENPPGCAP